MTRPVDGPLPWLPRWRSPVKAHIGPHVVVPMRYATNPLVQATAKQFVRAMAASPVQVLAAVPGPAPSF